MRLHIRFWVEDNFISIAEMKARRAIQSFKILCSNCVGADRPYLPVGSAKVSSAITTRLYLTIFVLFYISPDMKMDPRFPLGFVSSDCLKPNGAKLQYMAPLVVQAASS